MKKNISIFLGVLLVLSVIVFVLYPEKKINNTPKDSVENTETVVVDEYSGALMDLGEENEGDLSNSGVLTTSGNIASIEIIRSKDSKKCSTLDKDAEKECRDAIAYNLAIESLKYDDCNIIEDTVRQKECILKISQELYNSASEGVDCNKIQDSEIKTTCINRFKTSTTASDSIKSCSLLTDKKAVTQCMDDYYLNQVRSGKLTTLSTCDTISSVLGKRECRILINKATTTTTTTSSNSVLGTIETTCSGNNYCMKQKIVTEGVKLGNTDLCSGLTDVTMKQSCVDEISSQISKSLFDQAILNKDVNLCEKISDPNASKRCKEIVGK